MADIPAVVMAERRLNDAHTAASMATRDHARAIAYARRELAHALRLQEGPPPGDGPWIRPNLTDADRAQIRAVALAVGIDEDAAGTPLQNVEMLRHLPDNLAVELIEHWRAQAEGAWRCREMHHEGQIEQLRERINELTVAHECWTHSHPKEDAGHA